MALLSGGAAGTRAGPGHRRSPRSMFLVITYLAIHLLSRRSPFRWPGRASQPRAPSSTVARCAGPRADARRWLFFPGGRAPLSGGKWPVWWASMGASEWRLPRRHERALVLLNSLVRRSRPPDVLAGRPWARRCRGPDRPGRNPGGGRSTPGGPCAMFARSPGRRLAYSRVAKMPSIPSIAPGVTLSPGGLLRRSFLRADLRFASGRSGASLGPSTP